MIKRILQPLLTPGGWEVNLISVLYTHQVHTQKHREIANKLPFLIMFWFAFMFSRSCNYSLSSIEADYRTP